MDRKKFEDSIIQRFLSRKGGEHFELHPVHFHICSFFTYRLTPRSSSPNSTPIFTSRLPPAVKRREELEWVPYPRQVNGRHGENG
jgi:hypothetical protein